MDDINTVSPSPEEKGKNRKGKIALAIFSTALLVGIVSGIIIYNYKQTHISTDDAFIRRTVYTISPKVPGTVLHVFVQDNQEVRNGDILLQINPERYEVQLNEAEAGLETARRTLTGTEKAVEAGKAALELTEAELAQAKLDFNRAEKLFESAATPKSVYERARTAYDVALAGKAARKAELAALVSSLATVKSRIRAAEAAVENTKLNIKYTYVKAPGDGSVTRKNVEEGNFVSKGQPLMAIVSKENLWVVANFKETQIERMRKGDSVNIKIDTYPDRTLRGKVESIMAGTGAAFSLFPPENATGNYVKVVQRVPVKILFDGPLPEGISLRVGMSVVPTVLVSR